MFFISVTYFAHSETMVKAIVLGGYVTENSLPNIYIMFGKSCTALNL